MSAQAIETKSKAVALWNAIAEHDKSGGTRQGYASERVQRLTRDTLALAGEWTFTRVPQSLWFAVVAALRKETDRKHGLPWDWCLEVARQLLWMMDVDHMIHGLPVIDVGPVGKHGRHATVIKTGDETRKHNVRGITVLRLGELKEKGECAFTSRVDLMRFVDDLPELRLHMETVPSKTNIVRRLSVDARARITIA